MTAGTRCPKRYNDTPVWERAKGWRSAATQSKYRISQIRSRIVPSGATRRELKKRTTNQVDRKGNSPDPSDQGYSSRLQKKVRQTECLAPPRLVCFIDGSWWGRWFRQAVSPAIRTQQGLLSLPLAASSKQEESFPGNPSLNSFKPSARHPRARPPHKEAVTERWKAANGTPGHPRSQSRTVFANRFLCPWTLPPVKGRCRPPAPSS